MSGLDTWDIALLAISGYVAVVTLIRLMRRRSDGLIDELAEQAEAEKQLQEARKRREERKKARKMLRQREAA